MAMVGIVATKLGVVRSHGVVETVLAASNTLVYKGYAGESPVLILRNPTVGALSVTLDGDGGGGVGVPGIGVVDVSGGVVIGPIAPGGVEAVRLHSIRAYLRGSVTVSGGAGLVASLLEF